MTQEEAEIIAGIFRTADGYCTYCAHKLAEKAKEKFPQFDWHDLVERSAA